MKADAAKKTHGMSQGGKPFKKGPAANGGSIQKSILYRSIWVKLLPDALVFIERPTAPQKPTMTAARKRTHVNCIIFSLILLIS